MSAGLGGVLAGGPFETGPVLSPPHASETERGSEHSRLHDREQGTRFSCVAVASHANLGRLEVGISERPRGAPLGRPNAPVLPATIVLAL